MTFLKKASRVFSWFLILVIIVSVALLAVISLRKMIAQKPRDPAQTAHSEEFSEDSKRFVKSLFQILDTLEKGYYYGLSAEQKERIFTATREAINRETMTLDCHTFILPAKSGAHVKEELSGNVAGIGTNISVHSDDNKDAMLRAEKFGTRMRKKYKDAPMKCGAPPPLTAVEKQESEAIQKEARMLGAHGLFIVNALPNSPAKKAGLETGWTIRAVNGTSVVGMSIEDAAGLIKGEPGSTVKLLVMPPLRDSASENLQERTITRALVVVPQISSEVITILGKNGVPKKIGYLKISRFTKNSWEQFAEHLRALPPEKLIIDVRGNGGGDLPAIDKILDQLVPPGLPLLYMKTLPTGDIEGPYLVSVAEVPKLFSGKIAVLTDGYSASASEILAGVLRDHKLATLIGEKTYGKGSVQGIFPLPDGSLLKMTTALYALPSKELIDGKGIKPDIKVMDDPATEKDEVLDKALEFLSAQ